MKLKVGMYGHWKTKGKEEKYSAKGDRGIVEEVDFEYTFLGCLSMIKVDSSGTWVGFDHGPRVYKLEEVIGFRAVEFVPVKISGVEL